jgi:hypothetical protein
MRNTIRFDWAIKRLLRNKANFGILEGFLSELLGEDIKIDSILESESNRQTIDNKMNQVDPGSWTGKPAKKNMQVRK